MNISKTFKASAVNAAVVLALGVGVASGPAFGFGSVTGVNYGNMTVKALEDADPTGGQYVKVRNARYIMGIDRSNTADFNVTYTLTGATFAANPTLASSGGNADCNLNGGAIGQTTITFECDALAAGDIINAGDQLTLSGIEIETDATMCSASAEIGLNIYIDNEDDQPLDDTQTALDGLGGTPCNDPAVSPLLPAGCPIGPIVKMAPASWLTADMDMNTTVDVDTLPMPFLAFEPNAAAPEDFVDMARANFVWATQEGEPGDGIIPEQFATLQPYNLIGTDVVDFKIADDFAFAGASALCIENPGMPTYDTGNDGDPLTVDTATCDSAAGTFFDSTTGPAPGTMVSLANNPLNKVLVGPLTIDGVPGTEFGGIGGAPETVNFVHDTASMLNAPRQFGISGMVRGHKGCMVSHEGNDAWWMWKSEGGILEAHNVEYPDVGERNTFTLTNSCKFPIKYFAHVGGNTDLDKAKSCGSATPPASLICDGVIPAATLGQPGNVVRNTYELTKRPEHRELTARFVIAGPPVCVKGAYEMTTPNGRQITIMEYDSNMYR